MVWEEDVGATLGSRTPPSGCDRGRQSSSHWFPVVAHHRQACDGAMSPYGATIFCVHSMRSAVLGEGCSFPVNVGQGVSRAVPPSSGRSPLSRFPLRLVPSWPLTCAGVRAEGGVLRRSDWGWGRAHGLLAAWVRLLPGSPVWEVPCGCLVSTGGDTFWGSFSVAGYGSRMYVQVVVLRVVLSGRG